jgi:hypothetical protein
MKTTIILAIAVLTMGLGSAFTTDYRNNTTANNTTMDAFALLIGDEQTFTTPNTVNIGMAPNHTMASTDLYPGMHLTREQAFPITTHTDGYMPDSEGNMVPFAYFNAPQTPVEPIIGFH